MLVTYILCKHTISEIHVIMKSRTAAGALDIEEEGHVICVCGQNTKGFHVKQLGLWPYLHATE